MADENGCERSHSSPIHPSTAVDLFSLVAEVTRADAEKVL